MEFPKEVKDIVFRLLNQPTLDNFRDFMVSHTGEHNTIDFKENWVDRTSLVKEILSIANSGGGLIIFGVHEKDDKTFEAKGLETLKDKAQISNEVKKFISTDLKYEVYDFAYSSSEYEKLQGKKFQMIVVEDTPKYLPFFLFMKEAKVIIRFILTDFI